LPVGKFRFGLHLAGYCRRKLRFYRYQFFASGIDDNVFIRDRPL
jgi:hypothetical protein